MSKTVTSITVTYDTFHKYGLTVTQCIILQLIKAYDDGAGTNVTNKVIADFFNINPVTVSRNITELEKRKYILAVYDYKKAKRIIYVLDGE